MSFQTIIQWTKRKRKESFRFRWYNRRQMCFHNNFGLNLKVDFLKRLEALWDTWCLFDWVIVLRLDILSRLKYVAEICIRFKVILLMKKDLCILRAKTFDIHGRLIQRWQVSLQQLSSKLDSLSRNQYCIHFEIHSFNRSEDFSHKILWKCSEKF